MYRLLSSASVSIFKIQRHWQGRGFSPRRVRKCCHEGRFLTCQEMNSGCRGMASVVAQAQHRPAEQSIVKNRKAEQNQGMIGRQLPSDERIGITCVQGEEAMQASIAKQTRVGELIFALGTRLRNLVWSAFPRALRTRSKNKTGEIPYGSGSGSGGPPRTAGPDVCDAHRELDVLITSATHGSSNGRPGAFRPLSIT